MPPMNGRAGKFLDEERMLREYPLHGPIGFLEVGGTGFTVNRENFARILFSRYALKDMFATLKIRDYVMIYLYQ